MFSALSSTIIKPRFPTFESLVKSKHYGQLASFAGKGTLTVQSTNSGITPKTVTSEIVSYFKRSTKAAEDQEFAKKLSTPEIIQNMDGMHVLTLMFQAARSKKKLQRFIPISLAFKKLSTWSRNWNERDISTFMYGIQSLEGIDNADSDLLLLAAQKIQESSSLLTSRALGNSLYGLHLLTSDVRGISELCLAMSVKIDTSPLNDLNGQDVGIGMYGMQGLSSKNNAVLTLLASFQRKIANSIIEFDSQAMSNALYGLQSLSSDDSSVVLDLCGSLAAKVAESPIEPTSLIPQAIGSALFGLQKLSSESLQVRALVSALNEKLQLLEAPLDSQAVGQALFGLQRMSSNNPEVRGLVSTFAMKLMAYPEATILDGKAIGLALYGLHSLSSDSPQVRQLLKALAQVMERSPGSVLAGSSLGDALYGMANMSYDCNELRQLLQAIANKMDGEGTGAGASSTAATATATATAPNKESVTAAGGKKVWTSNKSSTTPGKAKEESSPGRFEGQDLVNALFGLQGLSSEMYEVRVIIAKLAVRLKRSKISLLRPAQIGRALLGLRKCFIGPVLADSRLLQAIQATTSKTAASMNNNDYSEVRLLLGELTKRIRDSDRTRFTAAAISDSLYALQGMSSNLPEVQALCNELANKVSSSGPGVILTSEQLGRALYGLQGLSSSASLFEESAIGLDSDEVNFLISTLWDKIKLGLPAMKIRDIASGLMGLVQLRDPIANNIRQYLYLQILKIGMEREDRGALKKILQREEQQKRLQELSNSGAGDGSGWALSSTSTVVTPATATSRATATVVGDGEMIIDATPVTDAVSSAIGMPMISVDDTTSILLDSSQVMDEAIAGEEDFNAFELFQLSRALRLNNLLVPKWIQQEYERLEESHLAHAGYTTITPSTDDTPALPARQLISLSRSDALLLQRYQLKHQSASTSKAGAAGDVPGYSPTLQVNSLVDGFPCDIYDPTLRLNIELDSPQHRSAPSNLRFDLLRDNYFEEKRGISVERITIVGRSGDDVVKEMEKVIETYKERMEEREIQRIYSSAADIVNLYGGEPGNKKGSGSGNTGSGKPKLPGSAGKKGNSKDKEGK